MLKAEVVETLLFGFVTWTLDKDDLTELQATHYMFLLRIIGFQRRHQTAPTCSHAKALKKVQ